MCRLRGERRQLAISVSKQLEEIIHDKEELLRQLKNLEAREETLRRDRAALHNLVAPISDLADEVLATIFEATMELEETPFPRVGEIVSRVSHRWRSISVNTPKLWANVRFPGVRRGKWRERIAVYLARSNSIPLNIRVQLPRREDITVNFLETIGDHMGRCRQLLFGRPLGDDVLPILCESLFSRPLPLLTSFSLVLPQPTGGQKPLSFVPSHAPHLRTLEIGSFALRYHHVLHLDVFASLASLRLTEVVIHVTSYETIRGGFMNMQRLQHLEINLDNGLMEEIHSNLIPLPSVEFLHVSGHGYQYHLMPTFIGVIEAVSLKALSLRSWMDGCLRQRIINFPSLRHLVLTDISEVSCPGLTELSRTFPDIERLTWNIEEGIIKSVEETLTRIFRNIRGTEELLKWPQLHTIEISIAEGRREPRHDDSALSTAILELKQSSHSIRKLRLPAAFINSASQENMASLRALVTVEEYYDDWPTPFAGGLKRSVSAISLSAYRLDKPILRS